METTFTRVQRTMSDLFSLPPDRISLETSSEDLDAWDSMGHLMLVEALEQEFETQLTPEEVEGMKTVAAVVKVIDAR
jgi:acyl carrier protein